MIKRHNTIVIGLALLISAGIWVSAFNKKVNSGYHFTTKIFEGPGGWGYEVLLNDSLFIHQEFIPLLPGRKAFETRTQADQAARLIVDKLKGGQPPSMNSTELQRIYPEYKISHGQR
jgi:Domain of unknown function (DUF4907)